MIKSDSQRRLQARGWIWEGIGKLIEHKCNNPSCEIALGLPNKEYYKGYLNKIKWFRKKLSIYTYLVRNKEVKLYNPNEIII